jgi:hypothetical protein
MPPTPPPTTSTLFTRVIVRHQKIDNQLAEGGCVLNLCPVAAAAKDVQLAIVDPLVQGQ